MKHKKISTHNEIEKLRKVLGISKSATENEVKRIYRTLVKKWHPDANKSKQAHAKMQEINKAYGLIMKEQFNIIDPWEDYGKWWLGQFGNDPIWGDISAEDYKSGKFAGIKKSNQTKLPDKRRKNDLTGKFLDKKNRFAVIGVSKNPKKYGNKVYRELRWAGYEVYPVNPKIEKIGVDKCYPSLSKLPKVPDVINLVIPPKISENVVKEAVKLGIKKVWLQPGSESDKIIEYCKKHDVSVLHDLCIMIESRKNKQKNGG